MNFSSPPGMDGEERLLITKVQDYADLTAPAAATTPIRRRVAGITGGSA